MKKITIINGWHDLNTGDSAIIISMIKEIIKKYGKVDINIISELNSNNEFFENSINYIKETYKDLNIELIGSPFVKNYDNNKVREVLSIIKNLIISILPKKIFMKLVRKNEYYETLYSSDAIMSKGGHFIYDRKGIKGVIHLFKCLYPMIIAKKMDKNYYIIAQSIGPFNKNSLTSNISFNLCKNVLKSAKKISLREVESYNCLKKYNLVDNVNLTSDYAFLLEKSNIMNDKLNSIVNKGKFVVFTIRQHDFKKYNGNEEYLETMNKLAKFIKDKYKYNIVFVAHVKGPNRFEDDRIIVNQLKKLDEDENYIYITEQYAPQVYNCFYSKAELMIGTRFHSVIFALANNVPSLAISYSGYKANIMKQFEMEKYMIDINEVNLNNYNKIKKLVVKLIENKEIYRKILQQKNKEVLELIENDIALNDMIENL